MGLRVEKNGDDRGYYVLIPEAKGMTFLQVFQGGGFRPELDEETYPGAEGRFARLDFPATTDYLKLRAFVRELKE